MAKIEEKTLEKLYGKKICHQQINFQDSEFFGDKKKRVIDFDLYDGFGYCEDFEGRELFLTYPKLDFIKEVKEMQQCIREFMGLNDEDEITVVHIVKSYCQLGEI